RYHAEGLPRGYHMESGQSLPNRHGEADGTLGTGTQSSAFTANRAKRSGYRCCFRDSVESTRRGTHHPDRPTCSGSESTTGGTDRCETYPDNLWSSRVRRSRGTDVVRPKSHR